MRASALVLLSFHVAATMAYAGVMVRSRQPTAASALTHAPAQIGASSAPTIMRAPALSLRSKGLIMRQMDREPWYSSPDLGRAQAVSFRWVSLQACTDFLALLGVAYATGSDPVELLLSGTAFWLIAGPAFITFGFVWRRINLTGERAGRPPVDWSKDPVVKWLGGEDEVAAIRKIIFSMTSW